MNKVYDAAIIGSGPSGVAAAHILASRGMSVLLLEKGKDMLKRRDTINGWFGRALYGMHRVRLSDPILRNKKVFREALVIVQKATRWKDVLSAKEYEEPPIECGYELAAYFFNKLEDKVDIKFDTEVTDIVKKRQIKITTSKGEFVAKRCVFASGRHSLLWLQKVCPTLGISCADLETHIGVRIELPHRLAKDAIDVEENIEVNDVVGDDISTHSFVSEWEEAGILSAQGCSAPQKPTGQTSLMLGFNPEVSAEEVMRTVKIINVLSNDKIRRERVKDFMEHRSILEHIDMFDKLHDTFEHINEDVPTFINCAMMYIPEVRWKGILPVNSRMKTGVNGIYGIGECSTRASTIIGAMASGLIVARTILGE